jgi:hypothetical protein
MLGPLSIPDDTFYVAVSGSRDTAEDRRSRSPISSHVVPQFPYSSQLVQPLPAAPELLPSTSSQQSSPRITLSLGDLPESDKANALIEHFEFYSNAAFPILHSLTLRRNVTSIYETKPVTTGEACCVLCECKAALGSKGAYISDVCGLDPVVVEKVCVVRHHWHQT